MELLSTGQAARLLGTSRQHVVDLCETGRLEHFTIGTHRRIPRPALDAWGLGPTSDGSLRREQLVSLWLHHAVAGRLVQDPKAVLERARRNLTVLANVNPSAKPYLDAWRRLIDAGPDAVLRALTSVKPAAVELRQNSPFAGILTDAARRDVLAASRAAAAAPLGP